MYDRRLAVIFSFVFVVILVLHISNRIHQASRTLPQHGKVDSSSKGYSAAQPYHDYSRESLNMPTLAKSVSKKSLRKPNVIFAMADCLGWGDVQYNNGNANTPNLKEMARSSNSILLQRYYSGSPVSSSTRGTVLTGRNHNRYCLWAVNGGFNRPDFTRPQLMPLPLSEITVAELLRGAGYSTALFGKWHLGDFKELKGGSKKWPVSHPGLHGFDQWQATERSVQTCSSNCGCFPGAKCINGHYGDTPSCTNYYTNKSDTIKGWPKPISEGDSHFIWSLAENYIKEQVKANRPFFLYLPFHAVHMRYVATDYYRNMYQAQGRSLSQDSIDYYGTISELDDVIGKLRNLLQQLGIRDNTLLWFSSGNGPDEFSPGKTNGLRGAEGSLYEGGIRVPGIIEWPDVITSNKMSSSFSVISSDLLPTVCDIVGIKPPNDRPIDGISILPFLRGEMEQRNRSIYWLFRIPGNFNKGAYNIVSSGDRFKLIATYNDGKVTRHQLYDLVNDIQEKVDLSKKLPSLSEKLLRGVENWRNSVMDSAQKVGCLMDS